MGKMGLSFPKHLLRDPYLLLLELCRCKPHLLLA